MRSELKILLLGSGGQVGWELQRALAPLGDLVALGREAADFENPEALRALVRAQASDVLVNGAAYTAVDKAENDHDRAWVVNATSPGVLAEEMAALGGWFVHYSTDYVFEGLGEAWYREEDTTGPQGVYGASKLAGEHAIGAAGGKHLIFRTSWVFAARGANFAKTMLRLAGDRDEIKVVADQVGAPTSAELIGDVTALCQYRLQHDAKLAASASGIYHLVAASQTSWCDYARLVIGEAAALGRPLRTTADKVLPIPASAYPTPARRPANSRLDTARLRTTFGVNLPDWAVHVRRLVRELVTEGEP